MFLSLNRRKHEMCEIVLKCLRKLDHYHVVNFEFTGWMRIQNLQHDNFVFTPTQLIQNLQHDTNMIAGLMIKT